MTSCRPECVARDSDFDCSLARCFCQCHSTPRNVREFSVLNASEQTSESTSRQMASPANATPSFVINSNQTDVTGHSTPGGDSEEFGTSLQADGDDAEKAAFDWLLSISHTEMDDKRAVLRAKSLARLLHARDDAAIERCAVVLEEKASAWECDSGEFMHAASVLRGLKLGTRT